MTDEKCANVEMRTVAELRTFGQSPTADAAEGVASQRDVGFVSRLGTVPAERAALCVRGAASLSEGMPGAWPSRV